MDTRKPSVVTRHADVATDHIAPPAECLITKRTQVVSYYYFPPPEKELPPDALVTEKKDDPPSMVIEYQNLF